MNINDFTQFFDNPKVSSFNRSHPKDFDLRISQFIPVDWDLLSFGNSAKANSGHKMRLAPLLAPSFADLRLQEHAAIVPLRVIMEDYEQKFNFAKNRDGAALPSFSIIVYTSVCRALLRTGTPLQGSLLDFLGFPIFTDLYKSFYASIDSYTYLNQYSASSAVKISAFDFAPYASYINYYDINSKVSPVSISFTFRDTVISSSNSLGRNDYPIPLLLFALGFNSSSNITADTRLRKFFLKYGSNVDGSISTSFIPTVDQVVEYSDYETIDSLISAYINYLFSFAVDMYVSLVDFPDQYYSTLPLRAYWRVYYDFLTNGNFVDRDLELESNVFNFEDKVSLAASGILNNQSFEQNSTILKSLLLPANRLWDFDFFTSLLPSAAVDNSIEIPANSTVLDLAKLTALQKFVMKLSYSSRYRDQVWNIFKIKPSDARLQQSSIIHQKTHNVGIGEVLQTSETTPSAVLGSFAGRGYSSGRTKGYHIFCEEPCVLLDFVSLMPRAYFRDALHPLIHVDDILDFPIPDMDVLGNQPIYSDLVTGNPMDSDTVLGYGRQYQEWLANYGTVHGQFKTTLDYWQLTRSFNEPAVINDDFLRMSDADDFDSIFSVSNAPHAMLSVYINRRVTRHVHRNVRIAI